MAGERLTEAAHWRILSEVIGVSEQMALAEIERRLTLEFPEAAPDAIDAAVQQAHSRFAASKIRDYVPLFVEKHARQQLSRTAVTAAI
jgi:hypothetical protein